MISRGSGSAFGRADSLDLAQVEQIVAGKQPPEMFDALLTPFGMHADSAEVLRRRAFEQSEVAAAYHKFYHECRIIGADTEALRDARLRLLSATRTVLGNGLKVLGISAPERM